ncbi:hypothetical protein SEA_EDUGATOR_77 [Mycobacterium phage Edugator]|uniref:Uncharacterized protein n=3 Tax=Kratiovirus larva TaxID=1056831 RepID=A0A222ZLZ1_9CAUD|nr:hypothetical protein CL76_gp22 [Mycobacterium phage Larva]AEL19728.1 hypothetical protein LARVA_80 [Mycobacterium phage Larva]ASR85774.1 hypothetical protein SEA_EDUGATOR_77 [Mycobacterium phage Edugator]QQV92681.1 hypothetical protein SEA_PSYCHO_79 [Mycobacterium phage Psycho]WAB09762.1 hypothetical protein SEA_DADOSKY_81 [Mycobacterium phage Dadosky]
MADNETVDDLRNAANARVRAAQREIYPDVEMTQRELCILAPCCSAGMHSRFRRRHGERIRQFNPWIFGVDYFGAWREPWRQWLRRITKEVLRHG